MKKKKNFHLFLLAKFEQKGLFISFKLIKKKKPKNLESKPVQYLQTSRYVIPIPSENIPDKNTKKSSNFFFIEFPIIKLYNYYDNLFSSSKGYFSFSLNVNYYPDESPRLTRFKTEYKFIIMWALHNVYRLLVENSFLFFWLHPYFTEKKLKYFSNIFFKKMFEKFINPNLPLKWKKKENFISKQQGTALLQIWQLILKQLTFEIRKINYQFSDDELKFFSKALVDPLDANYHWPTWRLFLLGTSYHDGKISNSNSSFFWSFNQIPTSKNIDKKSFFFCKKLILAQFVFWKSLFLKLILDNKLIFNPQYINEFSFWLITLTNFNPKNNIYLSNPFLKEFVQNKFFSGQVQVNSVSIFNVPIPTHYIGTTKLFLKEKFLLQKTFNSKNIDFDLNILNEINLTEFLNKFLFFTSDLKRKNVFEQLIIKNKLISSEYQKICKNAKNFLFFKNLTPKTFIDFMNTDLNNENKISTFKNASFTTDFFENDSENENIIPIPNFLQEFFFMLCQPEISFQDLEEICIQPFLKHLPLFNFYKNLANSNFEEFIAPIAVFKEYLTLWDQYNIPSATFAYQALKELLKNLPNKDIALRRIEPFGLNPFFEFNNLLNSTEVEFPDSVNFFNYFNFLKKKMIKFPNILIYDIDKLNTENSFFLKNLFFFFNKFFFKKLISANLFFTDFFFKNLPYKLNCKFTALNSKLKKRIVLFTNFEFKTYHYNLKKSKKKFYFLIWEFHNNFDNLEDDFTQDFLSLNKSKYSTTDEIINKNKNFLKKTFISNINSWQKFFFITRLSFKNLQHLTFNQYLFNLKIINFFQVYWTFQNYSCFFDFFWKLQLKFLFRGIYNFSSFDFLKISYILKYFKLIIIRQITLKLKN